MNPKYTKILIVFVLICSLFIIHSANLIFAQSAELQKAEKKALVEDKDKKTSQKPQKAKKKKKLTYESWLEKYSALDKLDEIYTEEVETPETIVKRAEISLEMDTPDQAIQILETSLVAEPNATKDSDKTEIQRLWLGGQAQRALGEPSKAVRWFSQAAKLMSKKQLVAKFSREPGLAIIWKDVWRQQFWEWIDTNDKNQAEIRQLFLKDTLNQALVVWKRDKFWKQVEKTFEQTTSESDELSGKTSKKDQPEEITRNDRDLIASALMSVTLEKYQEANATLEDITSKPVRNFWLSVVDSTVNGTNDKQLSYLNKQKYFKAAAFWESVMMQPANEKSIFWTLGDPTSYAWGRFKQRILRQDPESAIETLDNGSGSLLIPEETARLIQPLKFAVSVINGYSAIARNVWSNTLDIRSMPVGFKIAGALLWNDSLDGMLSEDPIVAAAEAPIISGLKQAAGIERKKPHIGHFWKKYNARNLSVVTENYWPLDKVMLMADWRARWNKKKDKTLARRAAFLFPKTKLGIDCMLYLAQQAVNSRNFKLASFYLNKLDGSMPTVESQAMLLETKANLAVLTGDKATALDNFKKLLDTGAEISDDSRLKLAFLLQQAGELSQGHDHLQILWEKHEELPSSMQAEILFWLGEGEQALGNNDNALDHYLKLAWQYPGETMWALTAMYRAALIYDKRGIYPPAQKLLKTVLKNAETEKQRMAAQARLSEIEMKMGRPAVKSKNPATAYPF